MCGGGVFFFLKEREFSFYLNLILCSISFCLCLGGSGGDDGSGVAACIFNVPICWWLR